MIIDPGVTSFDGANPGYTVFDLDLNRLISMNLRLTFVGIEKTYGWTSPYPPVSQWPWTTLNFSEYLNITDLTPYNIHLLHEKFASDDTLLKRYLSDKVGWDPDVPLEFQKAMGMYEDFGIITTKTQDTYPYKCQMNKSVFVNELLQCYEENKPKGVLKKYLSESATSRINTSQRDPQILE